MSIPVLSAYTTLTGVVEPSDLGRNLLRGTRFLSLADISEGGINLRRINSYDASKVSIADGIDGNKAVKIITSSGETDKYRGVFFKAKVEPDTDYTVSAWVRGTAETKMIIENIDSDGTTRGSFYDNTQQLMSSGWQRVTKTIHTHTTSDGYKGYVEVNFYVNEADTSFLLSEPKLERGSAATAFTVNEEDLKGPKGDKGDSAVTYDLVLSDSILNAYSNGEINGNDAKTVTCYVVKNKNGVATKVDTMEDAYFLFSSTMLNGTLNQDNTAYTSYEFTAHGLDSDGNGYKSYNFTLYVGNVAIKTVTLPIVRNGAQGDSVQGPPSVIYTIEPDGVNTASGTLVDEDGEQKIKVRIIGNVKLYKTKGDDKKVDYLPYQCWELAIGTNSYTGSTYFSTDGEIISVSYEMSYALNQTIPGSATLIAYSDSSRTTPVANMIIPVSLNPGAIQVIDQKLGKIQSTTASMQKDMSGMHGTIETIKQGQGAIELKVQDLQSGGIDTSKPHTTAIVDLTSMDENTFWPVCFRVVDDMGTRHKYEIMRKLDSTWGAPSYGRPNSNDGFQFDMVFSEVNDQWGGFESGVRVESMSQRLTAAEDTCICPRIEQYTPFSIIVAWMRGGSKYQCSVDAAGADIFCIWPCLTNFANNITWNPGVVVRLDRYWSYAVWKSADVFHRAIGKDDTGYYITYNESNIWKFGSLEAGNTVVAVGRPNDSEKYCYRSYHISSVDTSNKRIYIDLSSESYGTQDYNPIGVYAIDKLHYIKQDVWKDQGLFPAGAAKGTWNWYEQNYATAETISLDSNAIHAYYTGYSGALLIGYENQSTNGIYRRRAILAAVTDTYSQNDQAINCNQYMDVSPLYGTDGRANVKTDMLATGIDIKSHKITATTDNYEVRNNSGTTTFTIDKDGNIVGEGNASFKGTVYASGGSFTGTVTGAKIVGSTLQSSDGTNTTTIQGGSITTNSITATGGTVSFFKFDQEGLYTPYTEGDNGAKWNGIGMSINNISVSGNSNNRISSVYLGNGRIDSRWSNSNNRTTYRAGSTSLGSTFYNYIKLEKINSSYNSFENDPEHAALGVETQGDVCITALGGPSCFQGLCMPSENGSGSMTADGKRTMYLFSGGDFNMPSNPPDGLEIKVIQTGSKITFHANGHRFRNGQDYRDTFTSDTRGQWNFFYFDGFNWHWNYMNK